MIIVLATSCEENLSSGIIGTWEGYDPFVGFHVQVTFNRDGSLECFDEEQGSSGTYTVTEDNKIIMDSDCIIAKISWNIEALEGEKLYLSNEWGSLVLNKIQ